MKIALKSALCAEFYFLGNLAPCRAMPDEVYLPWTRVGEPHRCPTPPIPPPKPRSKRNTKRSRTSRSNRPRRSRSDCSSNRDRVNVLETCSQCSCRCERQSDCCCSNQPQVLVRRPRDKSSWLSSWVCFLLVFLMALGLAFYKIFIMDELATKQADANFALSSMGATIDTAASGVACSTKMRINDPRVIISGQPVIPGNAFCYQGCGEFVISLSAPAYITGISYEHIPKDAHPEKHIKSAPALLVLHGLVKAGRGPPREVFLGNFEYEDSNRALQSKYFKNINYENQFSKVKVSIHGNHGQAFTCLYRIQIHGRVSPPDCQTKQDTLSLFP